MCHLLRVRSSGEASTTEVHKGDASDHSKKRAYDDFFAAAGGQQSSQYYVL